jgi:hypothetical protein
MEIEKKHILRSYKSEQEAIKAVENIKAEESNPIKSTVAGYNVEKPEAEKFPVNPFQPGKIDLQLRKENVGIDFEDQSEHPDDLATDRADLDRPLTERAWHNRIR